MCFNTVSEAALGWEKRLRLAECWTRFTWQHDDGPQAALAICTQPPCQNKDSKASNQERKEHTMWHNQECTVHLNFGLFGIHGDRKNRLLYVVS